jgi:hypothetical protein
MFPFNISQLRRRYLVRAGSGCGRHSFEFNVSAFEGCGECARPRPCILMCRAEVITTEYFLNASLAEPRFQPNRPEASCGVF